MLRAVVWNFYRAFVNSYAINVILFLLVWGTTGESSNFIAFLASFAHWLWIPALFLLPVSLLTRHRLGVLLLLPACIAFVWHYGAFFVPRTPAPLATAPAHLATAPAQEGRIINLLTYNLLANKRDPQLILDAIQAIDADIVALQEVDAAYEADILRTFGRQYRFIRLHPELENGTKGQGILSKFPIMQDTYWEFSDLPYQLGYQRVIVRIDGVDVVLHNVHPTHPGISGKFFDPSNRNEEIRRLMEEVFPPDYDYPFLAVGDFNMPDLSEDYRRITATLTDSWRVAGWGMGWTFKLVGSSPIPPFLRLDYVFYGRGFTALSAEVGANAYGSDHHPLQVKLLFNP